MLPGQPRHVAGRYCARIGERLASGEWRIDATFLKRAADYEARRSGGVKLTVLSWLSPEAQIERMGETWIDGLSETDAERCIALRKLQMRRQAWLREQDVLQAGQATLSDEQRIRMRALDLKQNADAIAARSNRTAVDLDPGFEKAHFNAANLLMRLQVQVQAAQHYARVVELNPSDAFSRFMQAMAYVRLGHYQEAQSLLEESHRAFPEDVDITHALARLLVASPDGSVRNGRLALELLQKVFIAQRDSAFEHVETLAMAFAEIRQFEKAVEVQQGMIQEVNHGGRKDLAALLQENLSRYRQGQACRQPWRDDDPVFSPVPGELAPMRSSSEAGPVSPTSEQS